MGYLHIDNLYKNQAILLFRECYALEKIHGTSAHLTWTGSSTRAMLAGGKLTYSPGGESHDRFAALFDDARLRAAFEGMGHPSVAVHGEAYGGRQQRQAWRYGPDLRFVAFDVRVGDVWLAVPIAAQLVTETLGLEFVHFARVPTDLAALDAERDAPSEQARRNGVAGDQPREGIILRPLVEMRLNNDARVIAKHKRDEERETATPRRLAPGVDPTASRVLEDAGAIAFEWVTPTRLQHVLDKLLVVALLRGQGPLGIKHMRDVILAMQEDVLREGAGEFVDGREVRCAIGTRTAQLFKEHLKREMT